VCETYTSSTSRDRGSGVHLCMHDYAQFRSMTYSFGYKLHAVAKVGC